MREKRKILIVCEYFPPHVGGAEKLFGLHAKRLSKTNLFDIRVVTSRQAGCPKFEKIHSNCEVYRYDWLELFGHPIGSIFDILPHIRWANIVHTTTYSCALQAYILSYLYRKNSVLTIFEVLDKKWFLIANNNFAGFIYYLVEKLVLILPFNLIHAISKHTLDNYQKITRTKKGFFIYPFQEDEKIRKNNIKHQKYFLFFGRAGKTKGLYLLIDALLILKKKNIEPECVLIIAQHPEKERKQILDTIKQNQLQNVIIKSQQSKNKLQNYILNSKVVIVPSLTEGFGYSGYEASQKGIPVIYSSDTSLEEVVSYGAKFKNGDAESLAGVIMKVYLEKINWVKNKVSINNEKLIKDWVKLYKFLRKI